MRTFHIMIIMAVVGAVLASNILSIQPTQAQDKIPEYPEFKSLAKYLDGVESRNVSDWGFGMGGEDLQESELDQPSVYIINFEDGSTTISKEKQEKAWGNIGEPRRYGALFKLTDF
jgi:hypothetical protein